MTACAHHFALDNLLCELLAVLVRGNHSMMESSPFATVRDAARPRPLTSTFYPRHCTQSSTSITSFARAFALWVKPACPGSVRTRRVS